MIDVLLATFNGENVLEKTLQGYHRQKVDCGCKWRITVVNNGSIDRTEKVLQKYRSLLPLRVMDVSTPGKNRALNAALNKLEFSNRLVVMTDDDAIPKSDFISVWDAINPDISTLYGGTVKLFFADKVPEDVMAFEQYFGEIYAQNVLPSGAIQPQDIFGPNMAVPGRLFREGLRFDETIGPNSEHSMYPMGSETEFCVRVANQMSLQAHFVSEAVVEHIVRNKQLEIDFILNRAARHGRGVAMQEQLYRGSTIGLIGRLKRTINYRVQSFKSRTSAERLWQNAWNKGYLEQLNKGFPSSGRA